jgi:hypothetical protein
LLQKRPWIQIAKKYALYPTIYQRFEKKAARGDKKRYKNIWIMLEEFLSLHPL